MGRIPVVSGGAGQLAADFIILAIETVFLALRIFSRAISEAPFGPDDFLVVATYPFLVGVSVAEIVMVFYGGAGWHASKLLATYGPSPLETWLKCELVIAFTYLPALALPRLAIISLYLRIFIQKPVRIVCRALQFVIAAYPLAFLITFLTTCRPLSAFWTIDAPPGACGNLDAVEIFISVPNIVTDVVLLILPVYAIWAVQISLKDKVAVFIILGAGGMGLKLSRLFAPGYSCRRSL